MNSKGTNMPSELPGCCAGGSPDCCAKTTRVANMRFLRLLCGRFALGFGRERQAKEALILRRCSPTGKANHLVLGKAPLVDGLAYLCHEPAIKGHVVQRQQR